MKDNGGVIQGAGFVYLISHSGSAIEILPLIYFWVFLGSLSAPHLPVGPLDPSPGFQAGRQWQRQGVRDLLAFRRQGVPCG